MEKNEIIELFKSYCENDITGIFKILDRFNFMLTKTGTETSVPIMTSFYKDGFENNIIVIPDFIPCEQVIWILEYMLVNYMLRRTKDIYLTFTLDYKYDEEVTSIVEEINEGLNNGIKRYKQKHC